MKHFPHDYISPWCTHRPMMQSTSCGKCPLPLCASPRTYPETLQPLSQLVGNCAEAHPEVWFP